MYYDQDSLNKVNMLLKEDFFYLNYPIFTDLKEFKNKFFIEDTKILIDNVKFDSINNINEIIHINNDTIENYIEDNSGIRTFRIYF